MNYKKELLARYKATIDELETQVLDLEIERGVINEALFTKKIKMQLKDTERLKADADERTAKIQVVKEFIALQNKKIERLEKWQKQA